MVCGVRSCIALFSGAQHYLQKKVVARARARVCSALSRDEAPQGRGFVMTHQAVGGVVISINRARL